MEKIPRATFLIQLLKGSRSPYFKRRVYTSTDTEFRGQIQFETRSTVEEKIIEMFSIRTICQITIFTYFYYNWIRFKPESS